MRRAAVKSGPLVDPDVNLLMAGAQELHQRFINYESRGSYQRVTYGC